MTTKQVTLCGWIKRLGYSRGRQVQLYGERFDLMSDPFCVGDNCILVDALERRSGSQFTVGRRSDATLGHAHEQEDLI
jgi:hypothetical protein